LQVLALGDRAVVEPLLAELNVAPVEVVGDDDE
jgi:hypothetical protein